MTPSRPSPPWATSGNLTTPLSSNYDWATWNLGKDEYGAQTGVGKAIQGITEFAGTMALTGGFAGGGTTLAGQVVRGGVRGMAADALSAVSGDGNMSNMLEESFPELKDTWLTALAIDKEDNVFSAATKTALEGFGAGAAIETGVRMAWRGAKGLLKGKRCRGGQRGPGTYSCGWSALPRQQVKASRPLDSAPHLARVIRWVLVSTFSSNPNLARAYGPEVLEGSSRNLKIKELSRDELAALKKGDADGDPVDPQFLRNAFPDFDGVSVKGFYDSNPDYDEVVVFDPTKATELINTQPISASPPARAGG